MPNSQSVSPTMLLVLGLMTLKRQKRGPQWCREKSVGPLRELFKNSPANPPVVVADGQSWTMPESVAVVCTVLKMHCSLCGECEMAGR